MWVKSAQNPTSALSLLPPTADFGVAGVPVAFPSRTLVAGGDSLRRCTEWT